MYTLQHCSEPNSSTPLTAADSVEQIAMLNWVQQSFDSGNAALNDLITTLHGDAPGVPATGNAGVPTGYTPAPAGQPAGWIPRPGLNRLFPDWAYGPRSGFPSYPLTRPCTRPVVLPLETVLRAAGPPAITPAVQAPAKAAPVSTPAVIADCDVNAGNICQMIRDGCVLSSQVSQEQLQACSQAGWTGNRNLYPAVLARGGAQGGKYFGSLNLNPPSATGLSGIPDSPVSGSTLLLGLVALGIGGWALTRKGGSR